ncbi:MAG TPA: hypothetical protein VFK59_04915 [Actinomycetota bacterium]|nr:hypothetical protein [Actinomycetota bacterium]
MKASRYASTGVVIALAAALLATGVVVAGAHGGGPKRQVIHACVDDQTGAIEVVGANDNCGAGESPLDWNGKGPKGAQGPPGPQGESGFVDIQVVTASNLLDVVRSPALQVSEHGVGVDCPGSTRATGGGGAAGFIGTNGSGAPAVSSFEIPLVATVPLEKNSTDDLAETGDTATGWFAMGTDALNNAPNQLPYVEVTVWAVCVDDGQGPPDEDG